MVIKIFSAIFKIKSQQRATTPPPLPHVLFSPDASNIIFEIVILFKTVQRSYNKALGVDTNYQSLGARVVSYALVLSENQK